MKQTAKRDFTIHIVLILFTFSVYYFVWIYQMTREMNALENEKQRTPVFQLLLCLIPGYQIYWFYQSALRLSHLDDRKDVENYVILSVFFGAAASLLMQERINDILDRQEKLDRALPQIDSVISSDRYQRVFELPKNLYCPGAPLLLTEGSLLKDLEKEEVILQLNFENIGQKPIRAVMIGIDAFDITGKALEGMEEYQYLELSVDRTGDFGSRTAIALPNRFTRSVNVHMKKVLFEEGQWTAPDSGWENLTDFVAADFDAWDPEFRKQWFAEFGEEARFALHEHSDLWQCVCGCVNHREEDRCFACGKLYAALKENSMERIEDKKNARLAEEDRTRRRMLREKADAIKKTDLKPAVKLTWLLETLELLDRYENVQGEIEDCRRQLEEAKD